MKFFAWLILLGLMVSSASATVYYVGKTGNDSNTTTQAQNPSTPWLTIQHCATAMAAGDTCTVSAGSYNEAVTVTAGGVGSYKTITVNGSDVVTVLNFILNSHTRLIGNCTNVPATAGACGFILGGNNAIQSATISSACVAVSNGATDVYIKNNYMASCGYNGGGAATIVSASGSTGVSYLYIQGNTLTYGCGTAAAPKNCSGIVFNGDHGLFENNDLSHFGLAIQTFAQYTVIRNNKIHDMNETECNGYPSCTTPSGNGHLDIIYAERSNTVSAYLVHYQLWEGNTGNTVTGPDGKGLWTSANDPGGCSASVTSFTGTGGTLTFSASNSFTSGTQILLSGFTSPNAALNGQYVTVLSAGLDATHFEATVNGSGYSSGTGRGSGCFNVIGRHNTLAHFGSGVMSHTSGYHYVKFYNNDVIDAGMSAHGSNATIGNYLDGLSDYGGMVNTLFYFPFSITSQSWGWDAYNLQTSTNLAGYRSGANLAYCSIQPCALQVERSGSGASLFASDPNSSPANIMATSIDPLTNYAAGDFTLSTNSQAKTAGTYLTTVDPTDAGTGTTLKVVDAAFFQDGLGLNAAGVQPDCISIGTAANHACIAAGGVNYSTNTITLATSINRSSGQGVYLYSKSDGTQVLTGTSPDIGALPFTGTLPISTCSPSGGTYKSGRIVTCTNQVPAATMCWNMTTPPTTNGAGTCTSGTTYTGSFMVTDTGTLYVVGTQSGNIDATVSYSFTIKGGQWNKGWVMNVPEITASTSFGKRFSASYVRPDYIGQGVRTDLNAITWPTVPPQMGPNTCTAGNLHACGNQTGAGTCAVDSDFGYQVCRLTDTTLGRPAVKFYDMRIANSGSGDEQIFNSNSPPDRLLVGDAGGADLPLTFSDSGTSMTASRMYVSALPATNGFTFGSSYVAISWARSRGTPYLAYALTNDGTPRLVHFDFTSTTTPPSAVVDFDYTACLNASVGGSFGGITWTSNGASNFDDSAFGYAFSNSGGQAGTGANYVAVWKRGQGCRVLNLATLSVTGDWGPTGPITGTNVAPNFLKIHNVKMAKGVNAIGITANPTGADAPSGYVWFWDSLTLQPVCAVGAQCGGHWTYGMTHWFNNTGNALPNKFDVRTIGNAAGFTGVSTTPPTGLDFTDWHGGWNELDDSFPILGTTTHVATPCPILPGQTGSEEIVGMWPYLAPIMRFGKTLTEGCNPDFDAQNAIGGVSADGRYYAWTTDWMGTLGAASSNGLTGGSACDNSATPCRSDVFVVRLTK